jgi:hypothetical protein
MKATAANSAGTSNNFKFLIRMKAPRVIILLAMFLHALKKLSLAVLPALAVLAAGNAARAQNNVIGVIGDFENQNLTPWTITNGDGAQSAVAFDLQTAHAGKASLHLQKTGADGFVQLQSDFIAVESETPYRVSAWLNTLPRDLQFRAPSAANIYFMVSQFKPGETEMDLPNIFGPPRPFFSSDQKWEKLEMNFSTRAGVDRVKISLVFAGDIADLLIDDIQLQKLDKAEYKPRYEPPTAEKLIPLEDAQKVLQARPRATAEVRRNGRRPRLFIDGKESFPAFYLGQAWKGERSQIRDFKNAGVHVYLIPYILGRGVYGDFGVWSGPKQTDFSEVDEMLWRVLRADPHAYIMFYLATDPYPSWASENNLEDVVTDQFGNKVIVDMHFLRWDENKSGPQKIPGKSYIERYGHSYVSARLRRDTSEVLRAFDGHIKNSLAGKAVIGYHVIGGNDGQMFEWSDFGSGRLSDYSLANLQAFRVWLKTKYKTDAALQKAWSNSNVTFKTAAIPAAERRTTDRLFLNNPHDQDIVDLNRFRSEGIVDTLSEYAKTLRTSHGTPIVVGTYYAGPNAGVRSHRATGYLLEKRVFDYVTSVLTYNEIRLPGGPGKAHQAWSSLLLHNTFGLSEEDFRSWKSSYSTPENSFYVGRVETAAESNAMIRRDTGHMLALGQGVWWYDMSGGWFNDPSIMKAVEESVRGFRADLKNDDPPRAEVAVFIDEESSAHLASKDAATLEYNALNRQIVQLNSSGVPYHIYLQNDLLHPQLPDNYKLYVFLNAYRISSAEQNALRKLRRDGKTLVFLHAPGIISNSGSTPDAAAAISQITGIDVKAAGAQSLQLQPVAGNDLYAGTPNRASISAPTFAIADDRARPIAKYAGGQTAAAWKIFGDWNSVFFGGVGLNEFFFNALAKKAGAWVAADAGNAVYASQNFLTIHAMYPGEKTVRLLQPSKVVDLASGEVVAGSTPSLSLPMQRGETRWFRLEPVR